MLTDGPHVKVRLKLNFSVPSKINRKFPFWGNWGKYNISFPGPAKGISLRETMSFDVLSIKIGATAFYWGRELSEVQNPKESNIVNTR